MDDEKKLHFAYVWKLTWPAGARCDVRKLVHQFNPPQEMTSEDAISQSRAWVQRSIHHRRAGTFYYPLSVELIHESDPNDLPDICETRTEPKPLAATPPPLKKK